MLKRSIVSNLLGNEAHHFSMRLVCNRNCFLRLSIIIIIIIIIITTTITAIMRVRMHLLCV